MHPFSRLREQGRALLFVGLKALGVVLNVVLPWHSASPGFFPPGLAWVGLRRQPCRQCPDVAGNPRHRRSYRAQDQLALLAAVFAYSLPLLIGGLAGTANEFIDRQLIKYLVPEGPWRSWGFRRHHQRSPW